MKEVTLSFALNILGSILPGTIFGWVVYLLQNKVKGTLKSWYKLEVRWSIYEIKMSMVWLYGLLYNMLLISFSTWYMYYELFISVCLETHWHNFSKWRLEFGRIINCILLENTTFKFLSSMHGKIFSSNNDF